MENVVETKTCKISFISDGIIEQRYKQDLDYQLDVNEYSEVVRSTYGIANGNKVAILCIAGNQGLMDTPEVSELDFDMEHLVLAVAVVAEGLAQRFLANFFFRIKKFSFPTKLFRNEDSAVQWLQKQILSSNKI